MPFCNGRKDLATDHTPEQLIPDGVARGNRITNISLRAAKANSATAPVFVGGDDPATPLESNPLASGTGVPLYPGDGDAFSCTDAADVFISGPIGSVIYWRAKSM